MSGEDIEGETALSAANKEGDVTEPVALPKKKKSRIQIKATTDPLTSSQKDVQAEKAQKQLLDSSSQQDDSIEIRQSAMASERETPPEQPQTDIAHGEVAHTGEELTEAEGSTILRLESSEIAPLSSHVLGEDAAITAIHSAASTSPGLKTLDASADRGSDIGADRQPIGNEPDLTGEPTGKVLSPTLERAEEQIPTVTASVTLP